MRLKFIKNFKYIQVTKASALELRQLARITTGSTYNYGKKRDDTVSFLHNKTILPSGFWTTLVGMRKSGYEIEFENFNEFLGKRTSKDDLKEWLSKQDLNFQPYEYQLKGVHIAINFRQCRLLLDTSAGKSFLIYLTSLYYLKELLPKGRKILIIVPRTMLVTQLPKDFKEYSSSNEIICDEVMGNGVEREGSNVVVGNIDSVAKKPRSWFNQFGAVIMDEAHKINDSDKKGTNRMQQVMNTMFQNPNCDYILGMSGTFETKDNGASKFDEYKAVTETAYLGSVLQKLYVEDLKEYGTIAPVEIRVVKLKTDFNLSRDYYNHPDCQDEQGRFLFESNYIQGIPMYRSIINKIACNLDFNQVLLFNTKDFLYKMANECQEYIDKNGIDKKVYIINGDTKKKDRDDIIKKLNTESNGLLFAMYSILSTGVSVKSLGGLHMVDSTKAVTTVRQSIGRVLRLHPDKDMALVFDYVVNIPKYDKEFGGGHRNSYMNHHKERMHIYEKREFPTKILDFNLRGRSEFMDEIPRVHR